MTLNCQAKLTNDNGRIIFSGNFFWVIYKKQNEKLRVLAVYQNSNV